MGKPAENALAVTAIVVSVLALAATGWQGWVARDAEKRSLRAYVSADEPEVRPTTTSSAGTFVAWTIIPKWANHGSTPTRNSIVTTQCIAISAQGAISTAPTALAIPRPRNISPGHPIASDACPPTADQLADSIKNGSLNGGRSTVDYWDVFGEHHHSEQSFTIGFIGDPSHSPDPLRATHPCERNCEDEECEAR